jgi:hypothetical protein
MSTDEASAEVTPRAPPVTQSWFCGTCAYFQQTLDANGSLQDAGFCRYQPLATGLDPFAMVSASEDWCYYWKTGGPVAPATTREGQQLATDRLRAAGLLKKGKADKKKPKRKK